MSILNNINVLNRSNAQQRLQLSEPTQAESVRCGSVDFFKAMRII